MLTVRYELNIEKISMIPALPCCESAGCVQTLFPFTAMTRGYWCAPSLQSFVLSNCKQIWYNTKGNIVTVQLRATQWHRIGIWQYKFMPFIMSCLLEAVAALVLSMCPAQSSFYLTTLVCHSPVLLVGWAGCVIAISKPTRSDNWRLSDKIMTLSVKLCGP